MMRFEKWHALGNAYLLVEQPDAGRLTPQRVRRLCDVDTGIGSDGILEVSGRAAGRATVRIWNPDGSTAELSGNGTRIAAAWLLRESGLPEVGIETETRVVRAVPTASGLVRQDIGPATVAETETLDLAGEPLTVVPVDVGNPHAVVLREALSRDDLLRIGPALEAHPRFPQRTNVQLVTRGPGDTVAVLVWERGAGETAASGSSAVAVAAAVTEAGWAASPVRVTMPGGTLVVSIEDGRATLEGPAEEICAGTTAL